MKNVHLSFTALLLCGFCFFLPATVSAQTPCGNIIEYADDGEGNIIEYTTPIADCTNPFGIGAVNPDLTVSFGTTTVSSGGTYQFLDEPQKWNMEGYTAD